VEERRRFTQHNSERRAGKIMNATNTDLSQHGKLLITRKMISKGVELSSLGPAEAGGLSSQ